MKIEGSAYKVRKKEIKKEKEVEAGVLYKVVKSRKEEDAAWERKKRTAHSSSIAATRESEKECRGG